MKRKLGWVALFLAAVSLATYAGDYFVLRIRVARNWRPFGSAVVSRYYLIQEKGNKVEYVFRDSQPNACVQSLFPHLGDLPCWYLKRHTEEYINI